MCMTPGCGSGSRPPQRNTNSYTTKKAGAVGRVTKGSYTPRSKASVMSSFGKPTVRMSFSGKQRGY